ncbi:MAG TPA: hypothetical protein VNL14_17730 [Candidatus Acidoferrales bacterium]|nr:hypothetical protein [Candidatus Acidoferrales bacterium]
MAPPFLLQLGRKLTQVKWQRRRVREIVLQKPQPIRAAHVRTPTVKDGEIGDSLLGRQSARKRRSLEVNEKGFEAIFSFSDHDIAEV